MLAADPATVSTAYPSVSLSRSRSLKSEAKRTDASVCFRWSMGSMLFLASWAVLMGPVQYAQHLISGPRLPFTAAYFGSITLTLVFAIKVSAPPQPRRSCVAFGVCPGAYQPHFVLCLSRVFEACLLTGDSHDSCKAPS